MASTEGPVGLSDDEMKKLLEKYRQTAWNMCSKGPLTSYIVLARLLKVAQDYKDLELEGMQTVTTSRNFVDCVDKVIEDGRNAFVFSHEWVGNYSMITTVSKFVDEYQRSRDVDTFQSACMEYKMWEYSIEDLAHHFKKAHNVTAEVYACYITTRGPFHDQVIEALAAVRKELRTVKATVIYICSLLEEVNAQLSQVCEEYLDNIPKQLLVKFYVHSAFIDEIGTMLKVAERINLASDLAVYNYKLKFEEWYSKFEAKCQSAKEEIKIAIDDGEKRMQSRINDSIRVLNEKQ